MSPEIRFLLLEGPVPSWPASILGAGHMGSWGLQGPVRGETRKRAQSSQGPGSLPSSPCLTHTGRDAWPTCTQLRPHGLAQQRPRLHRGMARTSTPEGRRQCASFSGHPASHSLLTVSPRAASARHCGHPPPPSEGHRQVGAGQTKGVSSTQSLLSPGAGPTGHTRATCLQQPLTQDVPASP